MAGCVSKHVGGARSSSESSTRFRFWSHAPAFIASRRVLGVFGDAVDIDQFVMHMAKEPSNWRRHPTALASAPYRRVGRSACPPRCARHKPKFLSSAPEIRSPIKRLVAACVLTAAPRRPRPQDTTTELRQSVWSESPSEATTHRASRHTLIFLLDALRALPFIRDQPFLEVEQP
jgi:hypothetical protein